MKRIKIINGTYGHRPEGSKSTHPKTANDGPFEVNDSEAERLVAMGVAAHSGTVEVESRTDEDAYAKLEESLLGYIEGADDVSVAVTSAFELLAQAAIDAGVELPVNGVATSAGNGNGEGSGVNSSGQENGAEGADYDDGDGADIPEYNAEMSVADLKQIMEDCGLTYKAGMNRAYMVAALDEHFASTDDDGETPPALGTEEPVT